jgi:hypothetical protein
VEIDDDDEQSLESDVEDQTEVFVDAHDEENEEFWGEDADSDGEEINWHFNTPPHQPPRHFLGQSGPRHHLPVDKAGPLDYFNLFVPLHLFVQIAAYTNKRAEQTKAGSEGGRPWHPTTAAEIKAWFSTLVWWSLLKNSTLVQLLTFQIDSSLVKKWFGNLMRWEQIKRFLKLSDPDLDPQNKGDRMFKIKELWECFRCACKICFWPGCNLALDGGSLPSCGCVPHKGSTVRHVS